MPAEPLFDIDTHDSFGVMYLEVQEITQSYSNDFSDALLKKAREIATNTVFAYGSSIEDPRVLHEILRGAVRVAIGWAVAGGWIELKPEAKTNVVALPVASVDPEAN